jgi:hypothetical protein
MKDQKSKNKAAGIAWDMFEKTGDVGYYMLYCQLSRKD